MGYMRPHLAYLSVLTSLTNKEVVVRSKPLVSFLDRFYSHPMLGLDPSTTVFLCIAILLYVGSNISQHCVEMLLIFFNFT